MTAVHAPDGPPAGSDQLTLRRLRGRSLCKELDLTAAEFLALVRLAIHLKTERRRSGPGRRLAGRGVALIFEKASTRTRCAFEVAAHDEGAHVTYLGPGESQLGYKESVRDTARVLGRMYDGIEYRGFAHATVEDLARYAGVPVWNGLTDVWHPTQMLADVMTITECVPKPLTEVRLCYVGDGRNNTANSLLAMGAVLGMEVRVATPDALRPGPEVEQAVTARAAASGARLLVTADLDRAVAGADVLYTDVWLSMGEPAEAWAERIELLLPYQVNSRLLAATGNPAVRFMHCLPALHDRHTELGRTLFEAHGLPALEVTDDVFESPASVVFDEAENRMHSIKALMVATLGG
ncbi:MAG TPA: ornithine carbamoyltransferase [Acidimicrobiales bacterium]|nr:ornithine carbamoyltransferase [Acidimicrobiales bacterium]